MKPRSKIKPLRKYKRKLSRAMPLRDIPKGYQGATDPEAVKVYVGEFCRVRKYK